MKRLTPPLIGLLVFSARLMIPAPSDFYWPHCAARLLLAGANPYDPSCITHRPDGAIWAVYPFTTALALVPFAGLSLALATAAILGLSSALMAHGLLKRDPAHLMLFLSVPFLHAWFYGQWSPLLLGVALFPNLLPLVLIKPHIGLPAFLTSLTRRRVLAVALFGLVSLLIFPAWPWRWIELIGTYDDGYIPLLTVPGAVALLLLFRWRDPDARYLLLCAIVPQRGAYDPLIVAAALRSRLDVLVWVVSGWVALSLGLPFTTAVILGTYVSAGALLLARGRLCYTFPKRGVPCSNDSGASSAPSLKD